MIVHVLYGANKCLIESLTSFCENTTLATADIQTFYQIMDQMGIYPQLTFEQFMIKFVSTQFVKNNIDNILKETSRLNELTPFQTSLLI